MKLNIMREFIKLAETQNFSRTAEELYIAQSALSRHMVSLEEELRVQLIRRTRNSFELTEAGEIVRDEFISILAKYENLLDKLSRIDAMTKGEIKLGVLYYDMEFYVSKIREVFLQRCPNVKLTLLSYQPAQLEEDLLNGKLDAAIIYGVNDCPRQDIQHLPFLKLPYSLIYNKNHHLAQIRDLQISDLDGEKLLAPEIEFPINHADIRMKRMLEAGGARISEYISIHNYDEVPWMLKEAEAIYISPMANNRAYGSSTEYRFLQPDRYYTDVSLVWRTNQQNPAVNLLCSAIKICYP